MRTVRSKCRTQGNIRRFWHQWFHAFGYGILLALLGGPLGAIERIPVNNDSSYAPQPRLQVDMDDGSTCQVTDRSPASLVVYGRWRQGEESAGVGKNAPDSIAKAGDLGGGVALLVPLGGTGYKHTCSGLLDLQRSRARFALAQQLLEAGQLTDDDMKKVVKSMRGSLGLH
jgi:hypothetical protein